MPDLNAARPLRQCLLLGAFALCLQTAPAAPPAPPAPAKAALAAKPGKSAASGTAGDAARRDGATFSITPAPAWVVPAREKPAEAGRTRNPLSYRVIDDQTRLDAKGATSYSHVVRVVNDSSGLAQGSQVEIEFDPSYQKLSFHHFEVVRDGRHLNRLERGKVQLLQRETQLERRLYDGRVTASIVVDDVRVGDEIDFAYSIEGSNPVFEGRYANIAWMVSPRGPVALYQVRLLAPASRTIAHRLGAADMQLESRVDDQGQRETIVRRDNVPQLRGDAGTPYSALLRQQVQFSEFTDWAEVARWGASVFAAGGANGAALDRKVAEIEAAAPDPEQRLLAALRFVQQEVRYFGTEIGPNTHRPAAADKVLAQRFGDCKDKVNLLAALLQRLGIEAAPVLVSTALRGRVDTLLPSPLAFDHVIARVQLAGRTHHLDATRSHQSGPLASRGAVGFERGLVLAADSRELAALPSAYDQERMSVRDTFRVTRFASGATLEARITYRGDLAEGVSEALATRNAAELEAQVFMPYARLYPTLAALAPMQVERATSDDAVTLSQTFSIAEPWRFPEQRLLILEVAQWSLFDAMRVPNEPARRESYAIGLPGIYRHASVVEFAEEVFGTPASQRFDDGDARLKLQITAEAGGSRSEFAGELRLLTDEISPAEWPAHMALVSRLAPRAGLSVSVPALGLPGLQALQKELKELDESVRAKKVKVTTQTQYQSLAKSAVLSAQLREGRLTPPLQAQALAARGIQYDNLGRLDDALADFERALQLQPDAADTLNAAAVNALLLARYPRVISLADQVLARSPADAEARNVRAIASYLSKDYAAARAGFDDLLKNPAQVRRGYPIVWLSLMPPGDQQPAAASLRFADEQLPRDWPRPLVDWALGKASADALIASAAGPSARERLCEAFYYLGERYLADGDQRRAREHFRKAVEQGVTEFLEHGAASSRLASIGR